MPKLIAECNVRFSSRVATVQANDGFVSLEVKTQNGRTRHTKHKVYYLIAFEGFTWKERFFVLTTPFGFELERGKCYRNDITDPDEWCNCFKIAGDGPPGLWRLIFPMDPDADEDTLLNDDFVQDKMQNVFRSKGLII